MSNTKGIEKKCQDCSAIHGRDISVTVNNPPLRL